MSLTKEQRKAPSDRIMAKLGPLDEQEQAGLLIDLFKVGYEAGRREQKEADIKIAAAKYDELFELRNRSCVSDAGLRQLEVAGKFVNEVEQAIRKQEHRGARRAG